MAVIDGTTGNNPNLDGTAVADTINGFGGADTMRGFGGDDTINPGAGGSDIIDGSAGSDTLNLTGNFGDYAVSYSGANIILTNGATVETITGVETITFADKTVRVVGSGSELTTIQAAVNAAGNGDTILVQGGTYTEQVTIANKADITLAAVAGQTVTIAAPATLAQNATSSSGRELHAMVAVVDSTNVVIDGIDIDGVGAGDGVTGVNPNFVGVVYRNASGGLTNVDIAHVRQSYEAGATVSGQPILKAATVGFGVQVNNDATLPFFMTGGTISDCQVAGAVFSFTDLDVSGVTVIGGGDQTLRTQNGIQVGNSTGTISGNTITDYGFAGFDAIYNSGIRGFDNTNLTISNNTIIGGNGANTASKVVGIFTDTSNSGIIITGNTIDQADMAIIGTNLVSPDGYVINNNTVTNIDVFDAFYLASGSVLFTPDDNATTHNVDGTAFNDNLFGGSGTDRLAGLAGNDWTNGRGGDDLLSGGQGDDKIEGGDGVDTADYSAAGSGLTVDLNVLVAQSVSTTEGSDTLTGIENVVGSASGDTLTGDGSANTFEGRAGNDTLRGGNGSDNLIGGTGADAMTGGAGDDVYEVDQGGDQTIEAAAGGNDTVRARINWTLGANIEQLTLLGAVVTGNGNGLANTITGNAAANYLDGKAGADTMHGLDGADVYRVDSTGDVAIETNAAAAGGVDRVYASITHTLGANVERLVLDGTLNVAGTGNSLDNAMAGNTAYNFIDGKEGRDTLTGGGGSDQFLFSTALNPANNLDYITDFDVANDFLRLDDGVFAGLAAGYLTAAAFRVGTTAADATDRIIYNSATGAVFFDADGQGGAAQIQFARLSASLAISNSDIYVF